MTLSEQMRMRIEKIDSLIDKGYSLKIFNLQGLKFPKLISPKGKIVSVIRGKYGDDQLAGFSWIAFLFPFAVATQIRHWSYFWMLGILRFVLDFIIAIPFNLDSTISITVVIAFFYAYYFPYQRWLFSKSNKKEIGVAKSIFLGLLLSIIANLPSSFLHAVYT
tara:strand:+ start:152 stop:640 length:489 start_codon:yes stop_codon:yes gene_type:complete